MLLLKNSKFWSTLILLISVACLGAVVISIMGVRGDWIGIRSAFTTILYAVQAGVVILIAATVIFGFARGDIRSQLKSGLAIVLVLIPVIGHYATQPAKTIPGTPLNDISSNTINPPLFKAVIALRPKGSNSIEYPGSTAAVRQKELFPDIAPIVSTLSTEEAFKHALNIANAMRWEIVSQDMSTGIIEAVASTPVFSFEDDVVIRIQSGQSGSIVDIRSHSRVGRGDRGKNAQRVRNFIEQF